LKGLLNTSSKTTQPLLRGVAQAVIERIEQLAVFPGLGRSGEMTGTRELISPPCVVVYRSTEEIIEILYIWHGAQDWR
jgi:plasmid stabilization system protein ParE